MTRLICNVRGCARSLATDGVTLRCERGHSFDRARSGYWNLLQPQDRKSSAAGDRDEAVDARERWLARGHAVELAARIREIGRVETLRAGASVLDVGCGTGWFARQLVEAAALDLCGIDLSTRAATRAARQLPDAVWIVANADRGLPLADSSVDLALSIFGRRPVAELARVLRPDGTVVIVVPAEDDLAELREAAQGEATVTDRTPRIVGGLATAGLRLEREAIWRRREAHDRDGIDELLAMTYRGVRRSHRERLLRRLGGGLTLDVTLSARLLGFVRDQND